MRAIQKCALLLFHTFTNETTKITFKSYNQFPAVILLQYMVNVLFIVHILRFSIIRMRAQEYVSKIENFAYLATIISEVSLYFFSKSFSKHDHLPAFAFCKLNIHHKTCLFHMMSQEVALTLTHFNLMLINFCVDLVLK